MPPLHPRQPDKHREKSIKPFKGFLIFQFTASKVSRVGGFSLEFTIKKFFRRKKKSFNDSSGINSRRSVHITESPHSGESFIGKKAGGSGNIFKKASLMPGPYQF
jgi:hypothetical protein